MLRDRLLPAIVRGREEKRREKRREGGREGRRERRGKGGGGGGIMESHLMYCFV